MTRVVILACLLVAALTQLTWAKEGNSGPAKPTHDLRRVSNIATTTFEPGYLRLANGRRVLVPGLRYHASQRLVEIQDSLQPDSTYLWPLSSLRGFDLGADDLAPAPAAMLGGPVAPAGPRRFRNRLVREGRQNAHREAVEILTCVDAGPLVLACLPGAASGDAPKQVLVGVGTTPHEPLRPLELTQSAVLRLCGDRAPQVRAFAMTYNLRFEQSTDVARMFDHYNHLAVAKAE